MNVWEAIFLGALQGATEFLPVSSSGHLVVGQTLLGLEIRGVQFEVVVHVATLISVIVMYRGRLIELIHGTLRRDRDAWRYVGLLAAATLPAGIVGVFFRGAVQRHAAVVKPRTEPPNRMIAPAPRKPIPATTCAATRPGSPVRGSP